MSDHNLGFIIAAYALGFIVIAGMIIAVLYDRVTLKRALSKFSRSASDETAQ